MQRRQPISTLFPYTTLFRSCRKCPHKVHRMEMKTAISCTILRHTKILIAVGVSMVQLMAVFISMRSEERFSRNAETELVCRLLLEKKNASCPAVIEEHGSQG